VCADGFRPTALESASHGTLKVAADEEVRLDVREDSGSLLQFGGSVREASRVRPSTQRMTTTTTITTTITINPLCMCVYDCVCVCVHQMYAVVHDVAGGSCTLHRLAAALQLKPHRQPTDGSNAAPMLAPQQHASRSTLAEFRKRRTSSGRDVPSSGKRAAALEPGQTVMDTGVAQLPHAAPAVDTADSRAESIPSAPQAEPRDEAAAAAVALAEAALGCGANNSESQSLERRGVALHDDSSSGSSSSSEEEELPG
jgi:hypothetical protein